MPKIISDTLLLGNICRLIPSDTGLTINLETNEGDESSYTYDEFDLLIFELQIISAKMKFRRKAAEQPIQDPDYYTEGPGDY